MTDANEAVGKDVQQESSQEFVSGKGHLALLVAMRVILPAEGNVAIGKGKQSMIGNRDAVRVASQIVQDMLRPSKRPLGVNNPLPSKQRSKKLLEQFWAG